MKRKITIYLGSLLVMAIMISSSGCAAAAAVTPNCTSVSDYCGSGSALETCCTTTNCYYKWNGNRYNCNGTSCLDAAQDVANAACGSADANIEAQDLARKALIMAQESEEL